MELYLEGYLDWERRAPWEFQRALHKGLMEAFWGRITGRPHYLQAFDTLKTELNLVNRRLKGRGEIPLNRIVGSAGKQELFTRSLMPLAARLRNRWIAIYNLALGPRGFPLVEVYQVGDSYFILDGHHRASVSCYLGNQVIEANIIEWTVLPT
jgi:hypothetical protein